MNTYTVFLSIITIAILMFINNPNQIAFASTNFVSYENPVLGIKIKYPSDFDIEVLKEEKQAVIQLEKITGNPIDGFEIFISEINEDKTPRNYASERLKALETCSSELTMSYYGCVDEVHYTVAQLATNVTRFAGGAAFETSFSDTDFWGKEYKGKQISLVRDNIGYTITFDILDEEYDNYYPIVKEMIDSFEIVKTPSSIINSKE